MSQKRPSGAAADPAIPFYAPEEFEHRLTRINGIEMHYAECGEGAPVIFCHGFPHLWYSWRHQMRAAADAGYRAVALDMRGMGRTEAPAAVEAYGVDAVTADLLGLLEHLELDKAVFVGLDFGAFAIYDLALRHPEKVAAVIGLENPAAPHNPDKPPLQEYAEMGRKHFVHIDYFREPGPADRELNGAPAQFLAKVFYALSGEYHYLDVWQNPPGVGYLEALPEAPPFPWRWLGEDEMQVYVEEYTRSGFTGGLNWYRSMDLKWEQRKPFEGLGSPVPGYFIGSEQDPDLEGFHGDDPIALFRAQFPDTRAVDMIPQAGHTVQMERPAEVNGLMLKYLQELGW